MEEEKKSDVENTIGNAVSSDSSVTGVDGIFVDTIRWIIFSFFCKGFVKDFFKYVSIGYHAIPPSPTSDNNEERIGYDENADKDKRIIMVLQSSAGLKDLYK